MAKPRKPKVFEGIWDDKVKEAWFALNAKQQDFFLTWLDNGYNASEAYRKHYNKSANDNTACASGCRMLSNVNIQVISKKLTENKGSDLLKIKQVYNQAMAAVTPVFAEGTHVGDFDDHKTRINAAEKLARLNGELIDRIDSTHRFPEPVIFRNPSGEIYKKITFEDD